MNAARTVLYTGVTNNLKLRFIQHRNQKGKYKSFAGRYYCHKLIYFEIFDNPQEAIERETEIKKLSRAKKMELIKSKNPKLIFYNPW